MVTTGAKMTDVPGHTRGIVPPLAKHGVGLLEIGVNGGSTAAQLPPMFLWKDPAGASLPMMYHPDYEGIALVPGSDLAVVTRVRDDNSGPHTAEEIAKIHADLAARFPNAEIMAGSLTDMANAIAPHRDKLPVVTEEIGDTWIHGCASDPLEGGALSGGGAAARALDRDERVGGWRCNRSCAAAACAAGGRAHVGHRHQDVAGL